MHVNVCIYSLALFTARACEWQHPNSNKHTLSAQNLTSKYHNAKRNQAPWRKADSMDRTGKVQNETGTPYCARK